MRVPTALEFLHSRAERQQGAEADLLRDPLRSGGSHHPLQLQTLLRAETKGGLAASLSPPFQLFLLKTIGISLTWDSRRHQPTEIRGVRPALKSCCQTNKRKISRKDAFEMKIPKWFLSLSLSDFFQGSWEKAHQPSLVCTAFKKKKSRRCSLQPQEHLEREGRGREEAEPA